MLQFPRNMVLMKTYHKITANNNSHFLFLHLFFLPLFPIQLARYGLVGRFCQKKRTFTNVIFCVQTSQTWTIIRKMRQRNVHDGCIFTQWTRATARAMLE